MKLNASGPTRSSVTAQASDAGLAPNARPSSNETSGPPASPTGAALKDSFQVAQQRPSSPPGGPVTRPEKKPRTRRQAPKASTSAVPDAGSQVLADARAPRKSKLSVSPLPEGPLTKDEQLKVLATLIWLAKEKEEDRIRADKTHPGAPPGYGGVQEKLPPEVQEEAEKLQKRSTAADKGEKFVFVGKNGKVYVLCIEGQPDKKGVSVYEKDNPNPPTP